MMIQGQIKEDGSSLPADRFQGSGYEENKNVNIKKQNEGRKI